MSINAGEFGGDESDVAFRENSQVARPTRGLEVPAPENVLNAMNGRAQASGDYSHRQCDSSVCSHFRPPHVPVRRATCVLLKKHKLGSNAQRKIFRDHGLCQQRGLLPDVISSILASSPLLFSHTFAD
jgi:hypothetical protein